MRSPSEGALQAQSIHCSLAPRRKSCISQSKRSNKAMIYVLTSQEQLKKKKKGKSQAFIKQVNFSGFYFPSEPRALKGLYFKAFTLQLHETRTFKDAAYPSYLHSSRDFQTLAQTGWWGFSWWGNGDPPMGRCSWTPSISCRCDPWGQMGTEGSLVLQMWHKQGEVQRVPAPISKVTPGPSTQQD